METIFWQSLNKNNFNIFMRDLSQNSINLKHMLEDLNKEKKEVKKLKNLLKIIPNIKIHQSQK